MKSYRSAVPVPPARFGLCRGFARTYEMDANLPSGAYNPNPQAKFDRGQLMRGASPVFSLSTGVGYFMWDASQPNGWVHS